MKSHCLNFLAAIVLLAGCSGGTETPSVSTETRPTTPDLLEEIDVSAPAPTTSTSSDGTSGSASGQAASAQQESGHDEDGLRIGHYDTFS